MAAPVTETPMAPVLNAAGGSPFADQAMQLLDFNNKLDIQLLDSVVNCFYGSVGPEVSASSECDSGCGLV